MSSPAMNHPSTAELSAVTVERSNADQGRDLLPGTGAQFGKFHDQHAGGLVTDSRNTLQQQFQPAPFRRLTDPLINLPVDAGELIVEQANHRLEARLNSGFPRLLETIAFRSSH